MKLGSKQITLRPQDVVVALKLILIGERDFTYMSLGEDLALSASEVHGCINRGMLARLISVEEDRKIRPIRAAIHDFVLYGVKYAFPATVGVLAQGIATARGAPPFRGKFQQDDPPVWPTPHGEARGPSVTPLYPSLPMAATRDAKLYDFLAFIDALRVGSARERDFAIEQLSGRLA